jgi:hypothetical protein
MDEDSGARRTLGWRATAFGLFSYAIAVGVATYPMVTTFASRLPDGGDPLEHLWIMRWYKACLLQGRSPFFCPDLHAPVGVPLGYFVPLQWETLLYVPLSAILSNDALCYNVIWLLGFLTMGLGTALLAWQVLGDRWCAWLAGLLAMLSTPMMMHGHGHLETMQAGGFPLFLAAWLRLWDGPSLRRLWIAAGAYLFLIASAPYFLVLVVFPAGWYLGWRCLRAARDRELGAWFRPRLWWFASFVALVVPGILVLFSPQLWAAAQGGLMGRPESEFCHFGTRLWTYLVPTPLHPLAAWLTASPYATSDRARCLVESGSYLGAVTLGLMAVAVARREPIPRAIYWWTALALVVLLSLGANATIGTHRVALPSYWLWRVFPPYRLIRAPARFNLFAAVFAALLAAGGLQALLRLVRNSWGRAAVSLGLGAIALADLAMLPFCVPSAPPPVPPIYAKLLRQHKRAALLEVPQFRSDGSLLNAVCGFWQSTHGGRTSAGYSGLPNVAYDNLIYRTSPFQDVRLEDPNYLTEPRIPRLDLLRDVDFEAYVWLYLTYHDYRFIVLHREGLGGDPTHLVRLHERLRAALVNEDASLSIYDRDRLARPTAVTMLLAQDWRQRSGFGDHLTCALGRAAKVVVYQPVESGEVQLTLTAIAFRKPRDVRLLLNGEEVTHWRLSPDEAQSLTSPLFPLREGVHELTLQSDGESRPLHNREMASEGDRTPYSLRVAEIAIVSRPRDANLAVSAATAPRR